MANIFDQATSLAKAMAAWASAGLPLADRDEQKERHEICGVCPSLMCEEYRCGECKCYITIKASLKTSNCPLGKWRDLMKEGTGENKNMY